VLVTDETSALCLTMVESWIGLRSHLQAGSV
jgi:hypothetical protein